MDFKMERRDSDSYKQYIFISFISQGIWKAVGFF